MDFHGDPNDCIRLAIALRGVGHPVGIHLYLESAGIKRPQPPTQICVNLRNLRMNAVICEICGFNLWIRT